MADENKSYENRCFPKGIHIVGTDDESVLKVGEISRNEKNCVSQSLDNPNVKADEENTASQAVPPCSDKKAEELPWGYIFIQHMSAGTFERKLETRRLEGGYKPKCFIHRTMRYRKKPNGKGIIKEDKPTVSGLVFLQGKTEQLKSFLKHNFPQYFLERLQYRQTRRYCRLSDAPFHENHGRVAGTRYIPARPLCEIRERPCEAARPYRTVQGSGRLCRACHARPPAHNEFRRLCRGNQ